MKKILIWLAMVLAVFMTIQGVMAEDCVAENFSAPFLFYTKFNYNSSCDLRNTGWDFQPNQAVYPTNISGNWKLCVNSSLPDYATLPFSNPYYTNLLQIVFNISMSQQTQFTEELYYYDGTDMEFKMPFHLSFDCTDQPYYGITISVWNSTTAYSIFNNTYLADCGSNPERIEVRVVVFNNQNPSGWGFYNTTSMQNQAILPNTFMVIVDNTHVEYNIPMYENLTSGHSNLPDQLIYSFGSGTCIDDIGLYSSWAIYPVDFFFEYYPPICNQTYSPCGGGCPETDMSYMFSGIQNWSQIGDITGWNTSCITNMSYMFSASNFNQSIGSWDTSSVTDMSRMFYGGVSFNRNIGSWDTSNVINMDGMFASAVGFNQDISGWNTSSVTDMSWMFVNSVAFNQPIGSWDTSSVTNMSWMFETAKHFNQSLNSWDTGQVTDMNYMFYGATAFNQNLSGWNTSSVIDMSEMFGGVNLSTINYDSLLLGWSNQFVQNDVFFDGGYSQYSSAGLVGRDILTVTYNWNITDGGLNGSLPSPTSCNDTDKATYPTINYTLRGTMSATNITNRTDYCNANYVMEYYCDNSTSYHPVPVSHDCTADGLNCVNGSCVAVSSNGTCDDSDSLVYPTINYNLSGVVTTNNGTELTYTDSCYNSTHLLEYYCGSPTIPQVTNITYRCGNVGKICDSGQCVVNTTNATNCSVYSDSYVYPTIWLETFGYTDALTNHGGWIGYPYVIGQNPYNICNELFMDANISTDPVANVLNSTISTDFVLTFDIQPETDIGGNMYVLGGMPFFVFLLNSTGDELNPTIELEWGTDGKIYNHPHNASIQEIGNYQGSIDSYKLVVNMTTHTFKFYFTNSTDFYSFNLGCSNCSFKNNETIRQFEIYPLPPVYGNWTYNILGIWADNIKITLGAETAPPVNVTNYCYFTGCIFHDHFLYADDTYTHGWYMFNTTPTQSIVFYGNSTQGYSFDHYFNTFRNTDSGGLMSVQFRAMFPQPPESALDLNHFSIYSDLVTKPIDLEFSDGIIFDVNRGVSPVGTYAFGSWNTYTLLVNLQSNTYDLYQDSNRLVSGAPITQIVTEVSKVGFWVNTNSSMYLDYVTIANGSVLVDAITTGGVISDNGVPVADLTWCWSDTNGSFNWACCTAQENATRSFLCPARVTARFWLGSATTFILNNFIYFLVLIIIFVVITPYIAPKLRRQ